MFNRFFGQKPQEDPKRDENNESAPEQRFNFLSRTKQLFSRVTNVVKQSDTISDTLWDDLEEELLAADVGPSTSMWLIKRLRERATDEHMRTGSQVQHALREELVTLLGKPSPIRFSKQSPLTVILIIGVNGSGKTTSTRTWMCSKLAPAS